MPAAVNAVVNAEATAVTVVQQQINEQHLSIQARLRFRPSAAAVQLRNIAFPAV